MKTKITLLISVVTVIVLLNASCKKDIAGPVAKTSTDNVGLSRKVATSLVQSFSGKFGGVNVTDGIKAPKLISPTNNGPVLYGVNIFCGFTIDTSYRYETVSGDTTNFFGGRFKFTYLCQNSDHVNAYSVIDSVVTASSGPTLNNTYIIAQQWTVSALDQTYKYVAINGTQALSFFNGTEAPGKGLTDYSKVASDYTFNGLTVNFTAGPADIRGTVKFNTIVSTKFNPDVIYKGKIIFSGGNTSAVIDIDNNDAPGGKSYTVNLVSGQVTPLGSY